MSAPVERVPKDEDDSAGAIFAAARDRGRSMGLGYAGAVTPAEAWSLLGCAAAAIVDVRTPPEWQFVGHVPGVPLVVWPRDGSDDELQEFLEAIAERFSRERPLLFLCRSAVRSHFAADLAARAGYHEAYNVLEGFEGDGPGRGWRAAGLPWQKA